MRISVFDSKQLQAVILAMKSTDREIKKEIRRHTKLMVQPEWQKAVAENSSTRFENRVLVATARATVSDQNVMLQSARIGRSLSGGLKPSEKFYTAEFGADPNFHRTLTSKNGKRFDRHTRRQFRPRNPKGYVVYPAAAELIPRIASLWVQTIIRTFMDIAEGKKSG